MKQLVRLAVAVGLMASLTGMTFAQPDGAVAKSDKPNVETITFNEVAIEGNLMAPVGKLVYVRAKAKFGCLIQKRQSFMPQLERSTNNL